MGAPEATLSPRTIVRSGEPPESVGAVIVMFVLISRVEFNTSLALSLEVAAKNNASLNPIVAEAAARVFASSTDLRRVHSGLSDGRTSSSEVTQ